MDMELEQKQEELINHFVQQASSLSGPDLAFLIVEATSHPSLFAFSKILSVPSILQLEGTEDSVYLDVLRLFADGTLSDYKRNAGRLPQLVHDQELKLKQLTVLTLAETNKELPYDQLMQQLEVANVPELEEFLIHKCMHVGIVRGEVDTLRNRFEVQFAAVRNPRSLKDRAYWDHAQHRPWLISSLEVDGKEAEEPKEKKKKKKRKNKMKAKQKNSSHDDLEAKYGLDEEEGLMSGEEEGLKSEEAERLRSEEEEKKKGIIEDSGKTKTRTTEMNRQQRKRKKDRKARKRAAMVGENTSVKKKNKDKKGQKKEPVSTVPLDTSSSSGESESAQDEVSTVLSTPSKHQTGEAAEAAAIMHDVLANEDRIADERTAKASELKQRMALLEVECADLNHELQDMQKANMDAVMRNRELTVTRMMQAAWEREVELEHRALEASKALAGTQRIADERTAKASELEQRMALLEVECANLNHELQDMQKRIADERTAKASELEQRMALLEVECANYQVECANLNQELQDMQKLNSDAHAFKQFEDSFNAKLEAQFQTLDQKFEKSFNSKLEAHYQTLGQQDVQLINMQRKLENQMTKIEKAVEQKLNSNADAFNQFEKLFNSKPEAQFQTLAQQAVQVVPPRNSVYSLVYQDMYADAFAVALAHGDVHLVAWICRTINLGRILPKFPFLLSQDQLIALFKLLASDVNNDRLHKIVWMMTVADCIILADPHSGECARSVLSLVNQSLFNILDTSLTSLTLNETEVRGIIQLTDIITRKLKSE